MMWALQYPAMFLAIAGAALVTSPRADRRAMGFVAWMVGNGLWVAFGFAIGAWGLAGQYLLFEGLAVVGFVRATRQVAEDGPGHGAEASRLGGYERCEACGRWADGEMMSIDLEGVWLCATCYTAEQGEAA